MWRLNLDLLDLCIHGSSLSERDFEEILFPFSPFGRMGWGMSTDLGCTLRNHMSLGSPNQLRSESLGWLLKAFRTLQLGT